MSVPNSNPPMMAAANEPNMASVSKGIIPKMVVREAIITGRKRLCELSINAARRFNSPVYLQRYFIHQHNTILINIPINPSVPTIATKLKVFPVSSMTATTPTKTRGIQQKIIIGLR